jgi:cytochrome c oxidase subunit 3
VNLFQELTKKPWLETGAPDGPVNGAAEGFAVPRSTLGLRVFMGVVTVVFCLFIVSYSDRMLIADWRAMPEPWLLWANTVILVFASSALHWATLAARRERMDDVKTGLVMGAAFSLAFITGQLFVWQMLVADGYFASSNPANAFFYVLTALHGLHLLGGIGALVLTFSKIRRKTEAAEIRQAVDLCAVYWHFLFVVWLVVFGLLLFT